MKYMDVAVLPVPTANKAAYLEHAKSALAALKRHGALSSSEAWGDDVPEGKTNSLRSAVLLKEDETVVVSHILWPSKAVRDAAWAKLMEEMLDMMGSMPFDGSRLIHGGFEVILEN